MSPAAPGQGDVADTPGRRDIVVIGASAGGVEATIRLVRDLPAGLTAAIFVVIHIPATAVSVLPRILTRAGRLEAAHATEGEPITCGVIRVAPPDCHLLLGRGHVHLGAGPREHGQRPAADALFRSAARHHGSRVIGVVLSGMLGDGALGLARIVKDGGLGIVQDPAGAAFSAMPKRAIAAARPQHVVGLDGIARLIAETAGMAVPAEVRVGAPATPLVTEEATMPEEPARTENQAAEHLAASQVKLTDQPPTVGDDRPGRPSGFSCPDCGGVLWEVNGEAAMELACRIGHIYTLESLAEAKNSALEGALWAGVRALEEQGSLLRRLASTQDTGTSSHLRFNERATDSDRQARLIRSLLEQRS